MLFLLPAALAVLLEVLLRVDRAEVVQDLVGLGQDAVEVGLALVQALAAPPPAPPTRGSSRCSIFSLLSRARCPLVTSSPRRSSPTSRAAPGRRRPRPAAPGGATAAAPRRAGSPRTRPRRRTRRAARRPP